jgi:2-oxoglutarate ferredoxin oxidoreductase subunit beta
MADKINVYAFKGLHGRVLPLAAGISLANSGLPVIAIAGDGGTFDEGMHHFIHSIRSNYNITFIVHNNCDFGLTKGQATPLTPEGEIMNSSPYGVVEKRINPVTLALNVGVTFVARGFTGNMVQLTQLIKAGINHNGFAFLDILQHCPTYNFFRDMKYLKDHVYDIKTDAQYQNTRDYASKIAADDLEKIATGILFQEMESKSYLDKLHYRGDKTTALKDEVQNYPLTELIATYK